MASNKIRGTMSAEELLALKGESAEKPAASADETVSEETREARLIIEALSAYRVNLQERINLDNENVARQQQFGRTDRVQFFLDRKARLEQTLARLERIINRMLDEGASA